MLEPWGAVVDEMISIVGVVAEAGSIGPVGGIWSSERRRC